MSSDQRPERAERQNKKSVGAKQGQRIKRRVIDVEKGIESKRRQECAGTSKPAECINEDRHKKDRLGK